RAFDHYDRAASVMRDGFPDKERLKALIAQTDEQLAEQAGELRKLWQPALSALHEGAHASKTRLCDTSLVDAPIINFLDYRWVSNAAAFETRLLRQDGDYEASVRTTLDAMSLGADVTNQGLLVHQMVGIAMLAIACDVWTDDALRALNPTAADEFASGLETLEAQLPRRTVTDAELLFVIEHVRRATQQARWTIGGSWRHGFSARWMLSDAILMTAQNYQRMDGVAASD